MKARLCTALLLLAALGGAPGSLAARETPPDPQAAPKGMDPKVWTLAMAAYDEAREKGVVKRQLLAVIDYSRPSKEKRLWVVNMWSGEVELHTWVAHGKGSGADTPTRFSNRRNSYASSVGVFVTGQSYWGEHGRALRLHGLERGVNDRAFARGVVLHGSRYVSKEAAEKDGRIGRSLGCPAVAQEDAKLLVPMLEDGALLFVWYPDVNWLARTRFIPDNMRVEAHALATLLAPLAPKRKKATPARGATTAVATTTNAPRAVVQTTSLGASAAER